LLLSRNRKLYFPPCAVRNRTIPTLFGLALLLMPLCPSTDPMIAANAKTDSINPEARSYLIEALKLIQKRALNRDKINFGELRKKALEMAATAQSRQDTYDAIRYAIKQLDDHHSLLFLPESLQKEEERTLAERSKRNEKAKDEKGKNEKGKTEKPKTPAPNTKVSFANPSGRMIQSGVHNIAYVLVPAFNAETLAESEEYASKLHNQVATLKNNAPEGWIVDLRGNTGGSPWPMLAGIGPLFGAREIGFFCAPKLKCSSWIYEDDKAYVIDKSKFWTDSVSAKKGGSVTIDGIPPVAVLLDVRTASATEAVAIAFAGRPNLRFFGAKTAGCTTATHGFPLADGAVLYLALENYEDRNGKVYPKGIEPDELVKPKEKGQSVDPVVEAANDWITGKKPINRGSAPK